MLEIRTIYRSLSFGVKRKHQEFERKGGVILLVSYLFFVLSLKLAKAVSAIAFFNVVFSFS